MKNNFPTERAGLFHSTLLKTGKFFLLLFLMLAVTQVYAQSKGRVQGKIKDPATGQGIPSATVLVEGTSTGTVADMYGNYALELNAGSHKLRISFVGYETQTRDVTIEAGQTVTLDIDLVEGSSLGEVVVVGTRLSAGRSNIETPVPVDVISAREITTYAQVDVAQIMSYVAPSFQSSRQSVTDGTDHIDPAGLRGLGPDQVLVLVNGKRRHTTSLVNINGSVGRGSVGTDMNSIPVAAIERIEVLRDGAAAQYGSDAIAGVINIVLKKDTGFRASAMAGVTAEGDGENIQADVNGGFKLGSRGFINLTGQVNYRDYTNRSGVDNAPLMFLGNASGAFIGNPTLDQRGVIKTRDDSIVNARGFNRQNMRIGNSISMNQGVFVNGGLGFGKNGEFYFSGGATHRTGKAAGFYRLASTTSPQIDLNLYPNGFLPFINSAVSDYSMIAGVRNKLGNWNFDLSNTFGSNGMRFDITNTLNASLMGTSPTEFYAGKLKFNQNTINLDISRRLEKFAGLDYMNVAGGAEFRIDNYQIMAGEEGSYINGGKKLSNGSPMAPGSQVFPGYQPSNEINKSRSNIALYADLETELKERWLIALAARNENYSDFGSTFNWKVATRLKLLENVSIRGAVSTGFRAPSLHQRYFNNTSTQFVSGLPTQVLTANNESPIVRAFGVPSLKAETSMSFSAGITANFFKILTFTADAYQIDIKNRIVLSTQFTRERNSSGMINPNGRVNKILAIDPSLADVNSVQFFTNAVNTRTRGIDVVLSAKFDALKGKFNLSAAANFNENEIIGDINSTTAIDTSAVLRNALFDRQQRSRIEVAQPKSKINLTAGYSVGKFNVQVRAVRFGKVQYVHNVDPAVNTAINPATDQTFSAKWVTDLTLGFKFNKYFSLSVGANNIFNVYPDRIFVDPRNLPSSSEYLTGYNPSRDASNRGRFLYNANQFGYNGAFYFVRGVFTM